MAQRLTGGAALLMITIGLASVLSTECGSASAGSIPIEQYKEPPNVAAKDYTIGVGDVLNIQVWDQPQMSGRMKVRTDGRISVPFVNDVDVSGKTPGALAAELEAGLKSQLVNPKVTVVVEEERPLTISVIGEVAKPGSQSFTRELGVAQALAAAGGLNNFAHKDRIYVVRATPTPVRIHFTYDQLTRQAGPASQFKLRPGDVVVVE
jgi:polysaccharide export outer membrane protein